MKQIHIEDLKIHDYLASNSGLYVEPNITGLETPEIRLPTFQRPNVDGAVVPNQLYGGRLISMTGLISGNTVALYRARRRLLLDAIRIKRNDAGTVLPLVLKFTTDDDIDMQVEVYAKNITMPDRFMTATHYKLDLFAPTLYLLGQELKTHNIFIFQGGGFAIPFEIPLDMSTGAATTTTLVNGGTVDSYPIYTIYGPADDPVFTNLTNGQQFSLNYTLSSGEYIVIDTVARTVAFYADSVTPPVNIKSSFTGDFMTLSPGSNELKFTNANFTDTGYISVVYRDSFSGV